MGSQRRRSLSGTAAASWATEGVCRRVGSLHKEIVPATPLNWKQVDIKEFGIRALDTMG